MQAAQQRPRSLSRNLDTSTSLVDKRVHHSRCCCGCDDDNNSCYDCQRDYHDYQYDCYDDNAYYHHYYYHYYYLLLLLLLLLLLPPPPPLRRRRRLLLLLRLQYGRTSTPTSRSVMASPNRERLLAGTVSSALGSWA